MKTLKQIREASGGKEAYQKFFNSLLKKYGVKSPSELDDKQKKKFYDEIDAGWESDDPNDKNERYEDPDNLDPEATVDGDEDQADKAASKDAGPLNAGYGKKKLKAHKMMKAGYKMNAAYHKESVKEAKKLKPGKGKAELDINWDGDKKDIKFATTKYKIKMKPHSDGAIITGDKAKLLAYLQGQDYAMDPEDIEDLYPELMESNYPKPLSIIRQNKVTDDALEEAYGINEKMAMCEDCGKMHEEGACKMDMEEANRFSVKLKGAAKDLFALSWKAGSKSKAYGDKEWDAAVDKMAAKYRDDNHTRISDKDIAAVKKAIKHESVSMEEGMSMRSIGLKGASKRSRDKARGANLSSAELKKAEKIAKKHSGDMKKAMAEIEKIKKGSSESDAVMALLKKFNEEIEERVDVDGRLLGFKSAQRRSEGEKQKGKVIVDRRTKGYKEAKVRSEKAKAKRLEAKKQKEFAEKYPKLDYAYGDETELRKTMEAASEVMGYKKKEEDAAVNNVGDGNVDMNTTGKSKKKKKELMAKRGY